MKQNSLDKNPQMWEYGGLRMNEVNFLKFCLYIHLIKERDKDSDNPYNTCWFPNLINEFLGGRPTVSEGQLWYYVYKWSHQFICPAVSLRGGWFEWKKLQSGEYYLDTYLKIYNEIEEHVRTTDITIDMVIGYYNPKEPADILPFYTTVYPDVASNLLKIKILNRYACMIYWEIKDNTWGLPNKIFKYKFDPYQFYISNEVTLKDKPKPELPAIHSFERYHARSEYMPVTGKINIKKSLDVINDADCAKELINIEGTIPIIDTNEIKGYEPGVLYFRDNVIPRKVIMTTIEKFKEMARNSENLNPSITIDQTWPTADYDPDNVGKFDVGIGDSNLLSNMYQMIAYVALNKSFDDVSFKDIRLEIVKDRNSETQNHILNEINSTFTNPFEERYSCPCGYLRGKLHEDDECGRCNGVVKYVEEKI